MSLTITAGAPIHSPATAAAVPPPQGFALSGKIMLSSIVVLFTVVLLILFVHLYVRWHVYRRERRRQRRRSRLIFSAAAADQAPRGLDPLVLKSLAVEIYYASDDVAECAVCISEFADGEKVRVLPRCDHRFHIDCIDMWFCTHSSCPLCRSAVEIESPAPAAPAPAVGSSSDSRSEAEELGQKSRILAIKRFLFRDQRPIGDLESGEAAERSHAPPAPPPPPPPTE